MASFLLRPLAQRDLDDALRRRADARTLGEAEELLDEFERIFGLIANQPLMGRPRPGLSQREASLRSFVSSPFLVFYVPVDAGIEIIRILHERRDAHRLVDE